MTCDLEEALGGYGLETYFQPIVSLSDQSVIGFEALSRWPSLDVQDTERVFAYATQIGRVEELERRCVDSAVAAAEGASIPAGAVLALNNEAATAPVGRRNSTALARVADRFQILMELTERDLYAHPAALLRKVDALRHDGFSIALDDVGAYRDSCAVLDVIRPDIIKLDLSLVQRSPTVDQARILTAVMAYREHSSAIILAEGIETAEHLEQAHALGADVGQGYLFGRPTTAPQGAGAEWKLPATDADTRYLAGTPFDSIAGNVHVRIARKETLLAFSRTIEHQVANSTDHQIVLAAVQQGRFFAGTTRRIYRDLAAGNPLVAVFGQALPAADDGDVVLQQLRPDDPLTNEWVVVAIGGHTAVAQLARELPDQDCADLDREFEFLIVHDRRLVAEAARNLMARIQKS